MKNDRLRLAKYLIRLAPLFIALLMMHLIFLSPSIRLRHYPDSVRTDPLLAAQKATPWNTWPVVTVGRSDSTHGVTLLVEEARKCFSEINLRLGFESRWYEIKFLFLGTIFLGFIGLVARAVWTQESTGMDVALKSSGMLLAAALGVIVSLAVDMHLRANRQVINYMGIWITEYVEPFYFGREPGTPLPFGAFYGWEAFLRAEALPDSVAGRIAHRDSAYRARELAGYAQRVARLRGGGGYHNDWLYSLSFWPYVFIMTVLAYAAYLCVHIHSQWERPALRMQWLRNSVFVALHLVIIFCAATTHIVPATFEVRILTLGQGSRHPCCCLQRCTGPLTAVG